MYSYIGKQRISLEDGVKVATRDALKKQPSNYRSTGIREIIRVTGSKGTVDFPIHHGLAVDFDANTMSVRRNEDVYKDLNAYQQKFVDSMWGTTTKILSNNVIGVAEVHRMTAFHLGTRGFNPDRGGGIQSLDGGQKAHIEAGIQSHDTSRDTKGCLG
jgi:ribosomal protein L6P/L9E